MEQARSIFSQNKLTSFILLSLGAHLLLFFCFKVDMSASFPPPDNSVVRLKTVRPAVVEEEIIPPPVPAPVEKPLPVEKAADQAARVTPEPKLLPAPPESVILDRIESLYSVPVRRGAASSAVSTSFGGIEGPKSMQFSAASVGAKVPKPVYPDIARRWGHEGLVVVEILIAEDGTVEKADLVESSGHMELDEAALQVILTKWKFAAAGYEIKTVKEFEFKLRR